MSNDKTDKSTAAEEAKKKTIRELKEFELNKKEADLSFKRKLSEFASKLPENEKKALNELLGTEDIQSNEGDADHSDVAVFLKPQQAHSGDEISVVLKPQKDRLNQDVAVFLKPQQAHLGTRVTVKYRDQEDKDAYLKPQQSHNPELDVHLKPQQSHNPELDVHLKPQQSHNPELDVHLKPQQSHNPEHDE